MSNYHLQNAIAICHNLEFDGSNHCLFEILNFFSTQYKITLVTPTDGPLRRKYQNIGINVLISPFLEVTDYRNFDEILDLLDPVKFAFINTVICADGMVEIAKRNIPHVWMIHEMWDINNLGASQGAIWDWKWPTKKAFFDGFNHAKNIVYPAAISRECYSALTEKKNIHVVYNGLSDEWFSIDKGQFNREALRKKMGYANEDIIFLHIGPICTRKAQMRSLNAFNLLKKRLPDVSVKLLYVGSRKILDSEIHYEKIMKEKIEELNLSKDIAFYPATSNMKPFYAVTDVLLVPSVSEVLPLVIFEGMAFHLPVIASKIDGIPEAIEHGKNGFLISQGDIAALEQYMQILACDSLLRKSLGDAGNKILRNRFRIQNMLNQYSMIVDAIIA